MKIEQLKEQLELHKSCAKQECARLHEQIIRNDFSIAKVSAAALCVWLTKVDLFEELIEEAKKHE